jgi:hypothetical protein
MQEIVASSILIGAVRVYWLADERQNGDSGELVRMNEF